LKDYLVSVSQILFPSPPIELAICAIMFLLSFLCCLFGGDTVATRKSPMAKITKRTVDALHPRVNPYVAFDGDVKGFGCRVMRSGVKSYILKYRPGAGGRATAKKRLTPSASTVP
jgi:hypothetical protein